MKKLGITSLSLALALGLSTLPVMLQAAPNAASSVATTTAAPATAASKVTGPQVKKEQVAVTDESTVSINTATAEEFANVMNGVGMKKRKPSSVTAKILGNLRISNNCVKFRELVLHCLNVTRTV
jgi:hypothetical protein